MDWEIEKDKTDKSFVVSCDGKKVFWIYFGRQVISGGKILTEAEAELLAIKIKELLGVEEDLEIFERCGGFIGQRVMDGLPEVCNHIIAAIDRIREAEKRLAKPPIFRVKISTTEGAYPNMLMTPAQIDANLAALQRAKGKL